MLKTIIQLLITVYFKNFLLKFNTFRSVTLRILLARCYTGRIVGKQYNIMRTIISQTETKITLSE